MAYKIKKPCSDKERIDFIIKYNHNQGLLIEETENFLYALEYDEIMENDLPIKDANFSKKQEQKEKEKIAMLSMTPLDFIKALESIGIPYTTIKQLCEENEEVDKQLRFCNMVYRGNELLDQFAKQFGITSEQLDLLFISKGN